jgi:peptidoglycan hydrolase-like protein with peptidoglycan-binding domain
MATHRSTVFVWAVCALPAAASGLLWIGCASSTDAQERSRPQKNIGQQQREDSLKADQARKSGELGTQPSASQDPSAVLSPNSTNPVQSVQAALKAHGHDPGPIDGVMGRRTQDALRAYQTAQHLKVTGRIDQGTLDKLGIRPAARNP